MMLSMIVSLDCQLMGSIRIFPSRDFQASARIFSSSDQQCLSSIFMLPPTSRNWFLCVLMLRRQPATDLSPNVKHLSEFKVIPESFTKSAVSWCISRVFLTRTGLVIALAHNDRSSAYDLGTTSGIRDSQCSIQVVTRLVKRIILSGHPCTIPLHGLNACVNVPSSWKNFVCVVQPS